MEQVKRKGGCLKWGLIAVGAFFLLGIIGSIFGGEDEKQTIKSEQLSANVATEKQETEEAEPESAWKYGEQKDEMTDAKNTWAVIKSENAIHQDFPYGGETYATITIRKTKQYGEDAFVKITQGQVLDNDYNGTNYITARFDGGTAKKYYFSGSNDGSTEYAFLNKPKDFIQQCRKASEIKIDLPLYQAGRPVFTFRTEVPLKWDE